METRQTGFLIPNEMCRYYSDPLGCEHDKEFHTCCKEECTLPKVLFGDENNNEQHMELQKSTTDDKSGYRCKVKEGWVDEGKIGTVLGKNVFAEQDWTPVLWDDEEDPTFFKTAGLNFITDESIRKEKEERVRRAKLYTDAIQKIADDPDFDVKIQELSKDLFTISEIELQRRFTI